MFLTAHLSNTRDFICWQVAKYVPLLPDLSIAVLSDISKLDCTGQKVDNLRNRWAYIAVFGLIFLSGRAMQLRNIALFSQFIARIFLNRYKKSRNRQN